MKRLKNSHFYIPWISLWLILMGMHAAVCSVLTGKNYIQNAWFLYGVAAFILMLLALLPRAMMVVGFLLGGGGIICWCWKYAERIRTDLMVLAYYINKKAYAYFHQDLIEKKWCQRGPLEANALLMIFCILFGIFIAFALFRYFNRFYGILPVFLIYCGGLMIGRAPESAATALLVGGLAVAFMWMSERQGVLRFAGSGRQEDTVKRYFLAASIIGIGLIGGWYCQEKIQKNVFANAREVQRKQYRMEMALQEKAEDIVQRVRGITGIDGGGALSNASPYYQERVMMRVTVKQKPKQSIYLHGFVGDIYHGGKWDVSEQLEDEKKPQAVGKQKLWEGEYLCSYDPDGYELDSAEDGETLLSGLGYEDEMEIQYKRKMRYSYQPYQLPAGRKKVPQKVRNVCRGGQDDSLVTYQTLARRINDETGAYYFQQDLSEIVAMVQNTLWQNAEYSLDLEPLPYDQDYAEYFLFISGKGYCEHFATAGTLLLRELGVPTRYATGYLVSGNQFSKNPDGTYSAEVLDSDAHAWCEVLTEENIWMPQEMTPGHSDITAGQIANTGGSVVKTDGAAELAGVDERDVQSPRATKKAKKAEKTEEPKEIKASKAPMEQAKATPTAGAKGTMGGGSDQGGPEEKTGFLTRLYLAYRKMPLWMQISFMALAVCILLVEAAVLIRRRRRRKWELRLERMRLKHPKRYVGMRLALLLERMKRAGLSVGAEMPERQWVQILGERFGEQIDRGEQDNLIELLRRAAFSEEEVKEEEISWLDLLCERLEAAADSASV